MHLLTLSGIFPRQQLLAMDSGVSKQQVPRFNSVSHGLASVDRLSLYEGAGNFRESGLWQARENQRFRLADRFLSWHEVPSVAEHFLEVGEHGGVRYKSSLGLIQFGGPSGVMDDMFGNFIARNGFSMPEAERRHCFPLYVVADDAFVPETTGLLPLEFTQYTPYIIFQRFASERRPDQRMRYVTSDPKAAEMLRTYLRLSYEGPRDTELSLDLDFMARLEHSNSTDKKALPKKRAELKYFHSVSAAELAQVDSFDENGFIKFGDVTLAKSAPLRYLIWESGRFIGKIDLAQFPAKNKMSHAKFVRIQDQEFVRQMDLIFKQGQPGIIPISTANGFTGGGAEGTSGFIVANGKKLLLVDPPRNVIEFFVRNNIPLSAIAGIMITHGHGDHLTVGFSELINTLPGVTVYATRTVMEMISLQVKMATSSAKSPDSWCKEILPLDTFCNVLGLPFVLRDNFHSVPAFGFEIWDQTMEQPAFVFSGDTAVSKDVLTGAVSRKIMSAARRRAVRRPLDIISTRYRRVPYVMMEAGSLIEQPRDPHTALSTLVEAVAQIQSLGGDVSRVRFYHNKQARIDAAAVGQAWRADSSGFVDLSEFFTPANILAAVPPANRAMAVSRQAG